MPVDRIHAARLDEETLLAVVEGSPNCIWITDDAGRVLHRNRRFLDYAGLAAGEDDESFAAPAHPHDEAEVSRRWAEAQAHGTPLELEFRLRRNDGVYRWFLMRAERLQREEGAAVWVASATDIDDRRRLQDAAAFLIAATGALADEREIRHALDTVGVIATGEFTDAFTVFVLEGERLVPFVHVDREPEIAAAMRDMLARFPIRGGDPIARIVRSDEPILVTRPSDEHETIAYDDEHREMLRKQRIGSAILAPLLSRGRAVGALGLLRRRDTPAFMERDIATVHILAHRIAASLDEVRTRESERRLAETFQASALPRRLPAPHGIEIKAIYNAAEVGINVGGDWYDAFEISPWRLVISVGDVAGKGVDAAATMAMIRHGIRFAAQRGQDPGDILAAVDGALRAEYPDVTATAFVAILDIRESRVRYASAGHPPAAMRTPTGAVRLLGRPAPPLGAWPPGLVPNVDAAPLAYGTLFALYTDGLTEFARDPIAGERRLTVAMRDPAVFASTNPARWLRDAVLRGARARDDVAIVTLAFGRTQGWTFEAADAMEAASARHDFETWLDANGEGDLYGAALVFGELVGNVVRHAPGPIELRAEWEPGGLALHALDRGPGFGLRGTTLPDPSSEGGRGLFIIAALADSLRVATTANGSHVRAVLPIRRKRQP